MWWIQWSAAVPHPHKQPAFVRRWKGGAPLPHEYCSICETRAGRSLSLFRQSKSEIDTPGKALGTEGSDKKKPRGPKGWRRKLGKKENLPGNREVKGKRKSRRLPIFPGRFQPSILGASGLNCRVRDGNGCTPTAIGTDYIPLLRVSYTLRTEQRKRRKGPQKGFCNMLSRCRSSPRSISTAKLKTSPSLHMQPIYQVVFLGPYLITQWDI